MSKSPKKGGKASKKDPGSAAEFGAEEQLKRAEAEIFALQRQLAERVHEANQARASEKAVRERLAAITEALEQQKANTLDITADISRQYKTLQEAMVRHAKELEENNRDLQQQLEQKEAAIKQQRMEKEQSDAEKDRQVRDLKKRIEDMSQEFADMLKETLEKMSERISGGVEDGVAES